MKWRTAAVIGWMAGCAAVVQASDMVPPELADIVRREKYPDHVAGQAIVKVVAEHARPVAYCPLRGVKCGLNATCEHAKQVRCVTDFRVTGIVWNGRNLDLPVRFDKYMDFKGTLFRDGDEAYVSLYIYKNGVAPQIDRVVRIRGGAFKPGELSPEKPEKTPAAPVAPPLPALPGPALRDK